MITRAEAIDKFPTLETCSGLDLAILRHAAIDCNDTEFKEAIDAVMKEMQLS